ncbi:MAG TPA: alkaline phosphatase family protein, partial [Acidimicrobiia bacterium]|nr:alkaline phosphatase family protein [Acidimicrobiia bacterium]
MDDATATSGDDLVRPDYAGGAVSSVVPALLGRRPAPWLPAGVEGARVAVLLVLDGFGWRALDAARARLPELAGLAGGPITTVVPSTTAAALTSIASGLAPAAHGMVGYRMLVGGQVLDTLRWKVPEGRPPEAASVTKVTSSFCGREVPTVVRAEFARTGFTESHMRGVRFVGWRTTATLVTHVRHLVDAGETFVYAYYDGVDKVAHEYGLTDGYFPAETLAADRLVGDLLDALPGDAVLVITADHGQVQFEEWITMEPVAP